MRDFFEELNRQQDERTADILDRRERDQVWVRITWRSELGRWSTEMQQTG